jgi:hypothetical protein
MAKIDTTKTPILAAMEAKQSGIKADAESLLTAARLDQNVKAISLTEVDPKTYKKIIMMLLNDGIGNHSAEGVALEYAISKPTAQAIIDDLAAGIMSATAEAPVKGGGKD